jgi:hypothetical protein
MKNIDKFLLFSKIYVGIVATAGGDAAEFLLALNVAQR